MAKPRKERKKLPEIKCGDSNCGEGLHIYRAKKKKKGKEYEGVPCRECGDDSIDWNEFRGRDLLDVEITFSNLKKEYIRNIFWNIEIDKYLKEEIMQKGRAKLKIEVRDRLVKVVKACPKDLFRDGTQTPLNKHNIIFFAQHATASCCRKCCQIWHNIPYDRELTSDDLNYLQGLIMRYIDGKLPDLPEESQLKLFNTFATEQSNTDSNGSNN